MAEVAEAKTLDERMDEHLDSREKETPTDTSTETKPEGTEATTKETATAEVDKTEQLKEVDDDASLSVEDKLAKVKEIIGDDEKAVDAYIKQKGYHNDPAWQKQRELIDRLKSEAGTKSTLAKEESEGLAEFMKFRKSAEYIQSSMKTQGYTQEAIDSKLKESGFDVKSKPEDDVQLVASKLGIKFEDMAPAKAQDMKVYIEDIAKVADILFQDRIAKILPDKLAPIEKHMAINEQSTQATKMMTTIKETIKTEGILDFDKDINPALNKFLDDNPDASQQDVLEHFKHINHKLSLERAKGGKRKEERDIKKGAIRHNTSTAKSGAGLPAKTGNFDTDVDNFFANSDVKG